MFRVKQGLSDIGRGLTGSAVGVGIPGFFMKYQGAFRGKHLDKPWDFTGGGVKRGGGRVHGGKEKEREDVLPQLSEFLLCR